MDKPKPPPMRRVIKGAFVFRELEPGEDAEAIMRRLDRWSIAGLATLVTVFLALLALAVSGWPGGN